LIWVLLINRKIISGVTEEAAEIVLTGWIRMTAAMPLPVKYRLSVLQQAIIGYFPDKTKNKLFCCCSNFNSTH
jgi:hypothetical protein